MISFFKPENLVSSAFVVLIFLFSSCGLEIIEYLDEPDYVYGHSYENAEQIDDYFIFQQDSNSGKSIFQGTEIYYRIYNNSSVLSSAVSSLDSLNSNSDSSGTFRNLTETKKYQRLNLHKAPSFPFVKASQRNVCVYIRPYTFQEEYPSSVVFYSSREGYTDGDEGTFAGYPRRSLSSDYGFNFNTSQYSRDKSVDKSYGPVPKKGDDDVEWSDSVTEDRTWYVDFWCVSVGTDAALSYSYSKLCHIGSVTIREKDFD